MSDHIYKLDLNSEAMEYAAQFSSFRHSLLSFKSKLNTHLFNLNTNRSLLLVPLIGQILTCLLQ